MSEKDFDFDFDLFSNDPDKQDTSQNNDVDPWSLEAMNLRDENSDTRDIFSSTEKSGKPQKKQKPQKDVKLTSVKKKKKKFKNMGALGRTVLSIFLICVIAGTVIVGAFGVYMFGFMDPNIDYNLNNLKLKYTSIVYAKDSNTGEYYELSSFHGEQNRIWVDYTDMSDYLADAIVSIEDKRFWDHEGVDWKRTIGAVLNELTNFWGNTQGGSTITQQLVKNLTRDDDMNYMRKVREIVRASQIEKEYHKSVILECYINTVHFGNGCDGIETAAKFYFGKEAKDLSLLECASLAATIRTPGVENPLDGPEANKERRELCLSLMLKDGAITQEQYDAAMKDTITVIGSDSGDDAVKKSQIYSWFEEALLDQVQNDLIEQKGYTEEEASDAIFSGGLRIYSTYNEVAQKALEETYNDNSNFVKDKSGEYPQSAQVIMDYQGHVVAMVGGRGEKTVNRGLNRATDSKRQPGSSIKPLAAYGPAIEFNKLTFSSHIHDFHLKLSNGKYYPPAAGSGSYVTTQKAIQSSLNPPAVRVVNELSPTKSFDFLRDRYHFSTLVESKTVDGVMLTDQTLSGMALGGMVDGVTVLEMTAAYASFGNLGIYYKPTTYTAVYDTFGNKLLEQDTRGEQVISPDTAGVMSELLQSVTVSGTAAGARFGSWPLMGKTGTTDNKHDCWMAGGSPHFVSVVWVGYDSSKDLPGGANAAVKVWRSSMQKLHKDLPLCDFNVSSGVSYRQYCKESGGLATSNCTDLGWGYYKESYLPTCSTHGGSILSKGSYPSPAGGKYVKNMPIVIPEAEDAQESINKQREQAKNEKADKK